ncbi:YihY/virulence factor BrkB family protein [Novosphingobium sp. KACC 22771]|uniref:YihY/virulence factor BrkB family protein n=1 Tax=Novosphingobium sp. KACC 22771 TaxID=3025670 RepID=UPI002366B52E|nr:YihY/virulence factor BrkB family protein [Novosphingobium sp. KACC 22771]WDF72813.1 YihY/virulence factor BrkB family protein [Novosphingobium sp. KACC 22771]
MRAICARNSDKDVPRFGKSGGRGRLPPLGTGGFVINVHLRDLTPEARRRRVARMRGGMGNRLRTHLGYRAFTVIQRVVTGVWRDGFIHAGNLAYMAILAIFPFFIVAGGLFSLVGEASERSYLIHSMLRVMPRVVASVLEPVARDVVEMRHGMLLWVGMVAGLWTVSSLIETVRDILRRAYGTTSNKRTFWRRRLAGSGLVMVAVILLLVSLYLQVAISTSLQMIPVATIRDSAMAFNLSLSRLVPMVVLFGSLYLLFFILTPEFYRRSAYPKWPGALLVTLWWGAVSLVLPWLLRWLFTYDQTYGGLAGSMIALFFFWLVGLGLVTGAELNAALAITPEERDWLGQADKRASDNMREDYE